MVPENPNSTKSPTNSATEKNSSVIDGDEEQRGSIPNAYGRTPTRPLTGLERVQLRTFQNQARADANRNVSNGDPSPSIPLSRSERNGRLSGPHGHPRDMTMGGASLNGNGMGMGIGMSSNQLASQSAPLDNIIDYRNEQLPQKERSTKSQSAFAENQGQLDREIGEALMDEDLQNDNQLRATAEVYGTRKNQGKLDPPIKKRNSKKSKEAATLIHRPKKEKGAQAIGPIDTTPAILGHHDPSKLLISFATVKLKPGRTDQWIPSKDVSYDLTQITNGAVFDFDDPAHIKRINVWRRQIFGRNFPKERKTRSFWLEGEKEYVVHLVRLQLQQGVGGCIKWNRLANEYNERFLGKRQRMGEKLLTQGRQNLGVLLAARPAPWRTSAAIQGMAYKWREVKALFRMAEKRAGWGVDNTLEYEESDSESEGADQSADEEEHPDPNPNPEPGVSPRKYGSYGTRDRGKGKGKAKSKSKSKSKAKKVEVEAEGISEQEEDDDDDMEMGMDECMTDSDDDMLL